MKWAAYCVALTHRMWFGVGGDGGCGECHLFLDIVCFLFVGLGLVWMVVLCVPSDYEEPGAVCRTERDKTARCGSRDVRPPPRGSDREVVDVLQDKTRNVSGWQEFVGAW